MNVNAGESQPQKIGTDHCLVGLYINDSAAYEVYSAASTSSAT